MTLESAVDKTPAVVWKSDYLLQTYAIALGTNAVVVAGQRTAAASQTEASYAVAALDVGDGTVLWSHPLPAQPAWWAVAVDKAGRIFISLLGSRVLSFVADRGAEM